MEGINASFNPWTLLDGDDPGDVVGKAKTKAKDDAAAPPHWASNKAMRASTPAKKKKNKKKKKQQPAASGDQAPANGKGPAGKQNGAMKANKNGGASTGGSKNQGAAKANKNGGASTGGGSKNQGAARQ